MITALYNVTTGECVKISLHGQLFDDRDGGAWGVLTDPQLPDGIETHERTREPGLLRWPGIAKIAEPKKNLVRSATLPEMKGFQLMDWPVEDHTFEVAIRCRSRTSHRGDVRRQGDIVVVRKPHWECGRKERTGVVWLRLHGLDEVCMLTLADSTLDNGALSGFEVTASTTAGAVDVAEGRPLRQGGFQKSRYSIPFMALKRRVPRFDAERAMDLDDAYQPFMGGIDLDPLPRQLTVRQALEEQREAGKSPEEIVEAFRPISRIQPDFNFSEGRVLGVRVLEIAGEYWLNPPLHIRGTGGHFLAPGPSLDVRGLVYDKQAGGYL